MRRRAFLVGAAALLLARCDTTYDLSLSLTDAAAGRAFGCDDDAGPLLNRLSGKQAFVVMDVIDVGTNVISCRTSSLLDLCGANPSPCKRVQRACFPVTVGSGGDLLAQTFAQLRAEDAGLTSIPVDRTVMIRMVATSESDCPDAPLDPKLVAGCAYSCPTKLNGSGTLDLDLDAPSYVQCDLAVTACADFGE